MHSDLRFVVRALARNRGFTLVAVLTLALGIGSAASIFSVTDWILFNSNKYPTDVYLIGGQTTDTPFMPIRFDFMTRAYEETTSAMTEYSKAAALTGNVVIDGEPVGTSWLGVSSGFFSMLGIKPALGRGFLPSEEGLGRNDVAVVSHQFWKTRLAGKDTALGQKIIIGDSVCTVVGVLRQGEVMPPYFWQDIYRPLAYQVDPAVPWMPQLFLLGRLRPGVTREQATKLLAGSPVDIPAPMKQWVSNDRPALSSLREMSQLFRPEIYWVMVGAVGFLYAIACLNASNLMLVRMLGQQRELSIRLALGAGRWRIVRQLLLESATLAVVASLLGAIVANWFFPLLLSAAGGSGSTPNGKRGPWAHGRWCCWADSRS